MKVREDGEAALAPELGTAEDDLRGRRGGDEELLRVRVTDLREKSLSIHREIGRRISEKIGYTALLVEVKLDLGTKWAIKYCWMIPCSIWKCKMFGSNPYAVALSLKR